jgi:hypothetical protein
MKKLADDAIPFALTFVLVCLGLGFVLLVYFGMTQPAHAAPAAGGKLTPCDPIALAGNVVVYYCEPDDGPSFYVNSVGFMFVAD